VEEANPQFVMLENVPGMLHKKNRHHLDALLDSFEALGYELSIGVLNAVDFGTPQNRKRLVILGGLGFKIEFPDETVLRPVTVSEAICDLEGCTEAPNHTPNRHAPHVIMRWKKLAEGETDPLYRRARLFADRPSSTIRAGGGYGPKGNHLAGFHPPIHYRLPRQLTVRESARIQGFPDDWIFGGSKTAQGRQVGNAVAPPMARAIAKQVRLALEREAGSVKI
jgi:DNA (cytosine-5)-methyltransferase 1